MRFVHFATMSDSLFLKIVWIWLVIHASRAAVAVDNSKQSSSTATGQQVTSLGQLYREARDGSTRRSDRCLNCPINDDRARYFDNSYYHYRQPSYATSRNRYADRNWYSQPDRYEERLRYDDRSQDYGNRYDERMGGYNRYDDRRTYYNVKPLSYTDTYDNKYAGYNDYRGNGYDNRDTYYASLPGRGGNEQYYRGGQDNIYDRYNTRTDYRDRDYTRDNSDYNARGSDYYRGADYYDGYQMSNRGAYDNRNFRPYDESYRGTSGFDSSGRGYYFANKQAQSPHQSYHHHYTQPQHNLSQNSPPLPQRPTQHQQHHHSQAHDSTAPTISGNTQHKDTDTESTAYGSRQRPLSMQYLFDRDSSDISDTNKDTKTTKSATTEQNAQSSSSSIIMDASNP